MSTLRSICGIAFIEWKLQVRSFVFWAALVIVLLYGWGQVIGTSPDLMFLPRQWIGGREDALTWLSIVLIFLVPTTVTRDRRTWAFIWTKPLVGEVYVAGKLLGALLVALTLASIELGGQAIIRIPHIPLLTLGALEIIAASLPSWVVGLVYIVTVYFLLSVPFKDHPLPAYVFCVIYFLVSLNAQDPVSIIGFIPTPVWFSDITGYGPESHLFTNHSLFFLSLIPLTIALALLLYPLRGRRSLAPATGKLIPIVLLMLSVGLTLWTGDNLIDWRNRVLANSSVYPLEELSTESVENVHVNAKFDLEDGRLVGEVMLSLTQPSTTVTFNVPRGISVLTANNCDGQPLQITQNNETTLQIAFATQICTTFEGTWQPDRQSYWYYNFVSFEFSRLYVSAYIDHDCTYLTPAAYWYPAPVGGYMWQAAHEVEITLPQDRAIFAYSPAETRLADGWVTYRWTSDNGRPYFALAAGNQRQILLPNGDEVWVSPEHEYGAAQAAAFFLEFLLPIDELIQRTINSYQIIEAPFLRHPVLGDGWVLLPEAFFISQPADGAIAYEFDKQSYGEQEAYRRQIYRIALGLLQGSAHFIDPSLEFSVSGVDTPNLLLDPTSGYIPLQESMAHYIALTLTDQMFNSDRLDDIMSVRIQYAERYLSDPDIVNMHPNAVLPDLQMPGPPYDRGWAFNQMFAALGRLERRIGREQTNHLIGILLERYAGRTISTTDWLIIIEEFAGSEARQEFATTYALRER